MRKFKILKACRDKYTGKMLLPGDVLEVTDARAVELRKAQKYCTELEDKAPVPDPVTDPVPEAPKAAPKKRAPRKKKEA